MQISIAQLATVTMKNRGIIESSTKAGCMYCGKIYEAKEIKNYTDGQKTCLCPHCNVDAVIGDQSGYELTEQSLAYANQYWFKKNK
mgnify:FL=1